LQQDGVCSKKEFVDQGLDLIQAFDQVGWRVREQLASTRTPSEVRGQVDARILAGERVNGAEMIRARGRPGRTSLKRDKKACVNARGNENTSRE
jgi:hypothetical protein